MPKRHALLLAAALLAVVGFAHAQAGRAFPYQVFVLDVAQDGPAVEGVEGLRTSPQATKAVNALSARGYAVDAVFSLGGGRVGLLTHRS